MEMKKGYRADACLVLCGVLLWFLADAARLRLEALKALTLCAGTVIPSLFPFMTVTALLVRLGFGQWLAPHTAGLMAPLFRLPGCASSALLLGLVGGYPIGARTAAELYASGALTCAEAERLLTFCNTSNPVFLISVPMAPSYRRRAADGTAASGTRHRPPQRSAGYFLSGPFPLRRLCVGSAGFRLRDAVRLRVCNALLCAGRAAAEPARTLGGADRGRYGAVLPDAAFAL